MEALLRYGDIEFTMNAAPSPSPNSTGIASFSIIASGFSCRASLGQNLVSVQKPIRANSSFRFGRSTQLETSHLYALARTMTSITRISDPGFINLFKDCIFNLSHQAIVSFNGAGVLIDLFVKKQERIAYEDGTGYDKDCSICLSGMKKEDTVVRTPCSHEFHYHCVKLWLNQRLTCPLCRYDRLV